MTLTVNDICELVKGELAGSGDAVVDHAASLQAAGPGAVTFAKREFLKEAAATKATAVLVPERVEGCQAVQIVVRNPYMAFVAVLELVAQQRQDHPGGVHATAVIGEGVTLGKDVGIGAHAVIGNGCVIGDRAVIYPNTTIAARCTIGKEAVIYANTAIREETVVGDRTIIHSNCSIGGDGFGYLQVAGGHKKIPQVGRVVIGNDVEIGCNCTVDRATVDETRIGNGVKIDNHSHLAHNVEIGDNSLLVAYARMGGGTKLGKNVLLLEDVGLTNNITLGDGCIVGACAKVSRSWPAGSRLLGAPAQKAEDEKRKLVLEKKLPRLYDHIRDLRDKMGKVTAFIEARKSGD